MDCNKKLLIVVCGSLTVLIYRYIRYRTSLQKLIEYHNKEKSFVNEVLFFSGYKNDECATHISRKIICSGGNCPYRKLKAITDCIDNCVKSLDICMHLLTSPEITDSIVDAKERGVKIRLVVDKDKSTNKNSSIAPLLLKGLEIKIPKYDKCMHCKMAILDGEKLLTGSLNWTYQGVHGNWDNIIITSQDDILSNAIQDFDYIWQDCSSYISLPS